MAPAYELPKKIASIPEALPLDPSVDSDIVVEV